MPLLLSRMVTRSNTMPDISSSVLLPNLSAWLLLRTVQSRTSRFRSGPAPADAFGQIPSSATSTLLFTIVTINLVGDRLRDVLNPRLQK